MTERDGHLDLAAWQAFFEQRLDAGARERALDHISSCPQCAGVFKSARTAALAHVNAAAPAAPPRRSHAIRNLVLVAATVEVVVMAAVFVYRDRSTPPAVVTPTPAASAPARDPARPRPAKPPVIIGAEQLLANRGDQANTRYLEALADALKPYEADHFDDAITRLTPLAAAHPDKFEPAFYLGASLMMGGRAREAVAVLEHALALAGDSRRADAEHALDAARQLAAQP